MTKYTLFGGLFLIGGLLLVLFQVIASIMADDDMDWKKLSLEAILDTKYTNWIDGIAWDTAHGALQYVATMPLFMILIIIGILLFIIGGLVHR